MDRIGPVRVNQPYNSGPIPSESTGSKLFEKIPGSLSPEDPQSLKNHEVNYDRIPYTDTLGKVASLMGQSWPATVKHCKDLIQTAFNSYLNRIMADLK